MYVKQLLAKRELVKMIIKFKPVTIFTLATKPNIPKKIDSNNQFDGIKRLVNNPIINFFFANVEQF